MYPVLVAMITPAQLTGLSSTPPQRHCHISRASIPNGSHSSQRQEQGLESSLGMLQAVLVGMCGGGEAMGKAKIISTLTMSSFTGVPGA